ncbi:MAG: prolyl oligopeptidase family serine peptidase [Sphingobacterium sp.]
MKQKLSLLLLGLGIFSFSWAQKRPIDHDVYDDWKSISRPDISPSGQFVFYTITPQQGDALGEVKTTDGTSILQIPRASRLQLTEDEEHVISLMDAPFQEMRQAKIDKKKAKQMPKDSLMVFTIKSGRMLKFAGVKSYKLPRKGSDHVAFLSTSEALSKKDSTDTISTSESKKGSESALHLLDLNSGDTSQIVKVDAYAWSDDGRFLVYSVDGGKKDSLNQSGLFLRDVTNSETEKISAGKGTYKSFTFDDASKQLVFLAEKHPEKALLKEYKLYYYKLAQDSAIILADRYKAGMPENWFVSGHGEVKFSKSGEKLYFGLAPIPSVKDTTLVEFEHAKVDIWHWQDEYLQPMQLARLKRDQTKSYTALLNLSAGRDKILPLSDDTFNRIELTGDADHTWALASSDKAYRIQTQWEGRSHHDIYAVSTETGEHKLISKSNGGQSYLSPNGEYVVYFDQDQLTWISFRIDEDKIAILNQDIAVSFVDEENDMPTDARPYGVAGWSKDGRSIYLNDRYDIWKITLDGKRKVNLTQGEGREKQVVYRVQNLLENDDPRVRHTIIDEKDGLYLSGFNKRTKHQGLYRLKGKRMEELWGGPFAYRSISADEKLRHIIYTKEDYAQSPDLYLLHDFKNESRLTTINPQQAQYNWGTAELVQWNTPNGHQGEGILYKPEDFDPNKTYPIIAYFYETLTDGLYTYQAPAPTPSRLNIPYFVSNGYLVFAPDIHYEVGYPGRSAEEYVNSGMQFLAEQNSWVDSTKMGIQGQSWGGYQVAHLITRTDMYAAAWSGAPVVNMTSAYGGIRWGTGMSRQFQYEKTQSRIGKPLWEAQDLYIENSPLFHMDQVNTPVAIMHNDNDGAVPWYQGIEFFTALRRLHKPVWLLNYNGDEHNLMKRQNRKDIQIREAQFFDHFLKGKPAANWIKHGVKATEKGIDWGLDVE